MKKQIISTAVLVTLLLLGFSTGDAKKKPEEPVRESFVANIEGFPGSPSLTVAIQDFSTDDEMRELAQSFARGGVDALRNAMGNSRKGYFKLGSSETTRLRIIQAQPVGVGRRLLLVGEAPRAFFPGGTAQDAGPAPRLVEVGHGGYNYSAIQLEVDAQGNGKGIMYSSCKVGFNKQGQLAITPMEASSPLTVVQAAHQPYQLVNVHWGK
jgi:hypothetical protein